MSNGTHIMMINSTDCTGTNTNFRSNLPRGLEPRRIELLYANIATDPIDTTGGFYRIDIPEFGRDMLDSTGLAHTTFLVPNIAALGTRAVYNEALNFKQDSEKSASSQITQLSVIIRNSDGSIATDSGFNQFIVRLTY